LFGISDFFVAFGSGGQNLLEMHYFGRSYLEIYLADFGENRLVGRPLS
jgi:hypothetical protein